MLSIAHATTGAVIATHLTPILAIPTILASHYLLDAIAHYDAGTGLSSGRKTRRTALILGIIDLCLAGLIVLLLYPGVGYKVWELKFWLSPPVWGAFLGLLPDFLEAPRNFLGSEPFFLRPLNRFHNLFHHSIPAIIPGLMPQIILLTILWLIH